MKDLGQLARQSEEDFASWFGKRRPLSGADQTNPGDVLGLGIYQDYLGENKFTTKLSRSLSLKELTKIKKEARVEGREWVFRLEFHNKERVIVMSENLFRRLAGE